jgi:hypothetical protein
MITIIEDGCSLGRGNWTFTPGKWIKLRQIVRLNSFKNSKPVADAKVWIYVNDKLVYETPPFVIRNTPEILPKGIQFETFFGGNDISWASPKDQNVQFKNISMNSY